MTPTTADPAAIRQALADNLAVLGSDITISAYELSAAYAPVVFVRGPKIMYDRTFGRGDDEHWYTIVLLVGMSAEVAAQMALDEYLNEGSAQSIKAAIESDTGLGGACQDLRVVEASGPQLYASDTAQGASIPPMLGCEWLVQVIA